MNRDMDIAGTSRYVSVDLGKAYLKSGDFMLFYKIIKKELPPVIIGSGIIISSQNNNSTVKVLDASYPVEVGDRAVLLPEISEELSKPEEKIPIVETLKKEQMESEEETIEIDVLFDLDSKSIGNNYLDDLKRIKEFTDSKSQYIVILRGYSCSIGGFEYNLQLSKERVENVKKILVTEHGIEENFIESYYYGEKENPFDDSLEAERRKNRLVRIQVIGK
jgi:outer membrane protein OmpA-like peptidoglycan-associated protein